MYFKYLTKFKEEARRRKSKSQFFDMIQEIRRAVHQQNEPKAVLAWGDPPTVPKVEEEVEHRRIIPDITFTSSFQDITQTSVLLHSCRYMAESPDEPDSLVDSYSSSSSASLNPCRTRLSASTGDLMQELSFPIYPRVRSLEDVYRRSSSTDRRMEDMSVTWHSSYAMDELRLLSMSKESIVRLWQGSERTLLNRLQDTLKEKKLLEQKLSFIQKTLLKPP